MVGEGAEFQAPELQKEELNFADDIRQTHYTLNKLEAQVHTGTID